MRLSGRKSSSATQHWTRRQCFILLTLLSANLVAFVAQLCVELYQPGFVHDYLGLSDRGVRDAYAWQFVTAIFLHDGPWHLLGNMLFLYFLGRDLESILGQRHFLYLYLAGAVGGELGHLFLMPSESVLLAASGGVAAVLVAYATILPELELSTSIFFLVPFSLKAKHLAYCATALAIALLCFDRTRTVSHSACLGGFAAGWLYAHLLGFGRTSFLQRHMQRRRAAAARYERLTIAELMTEEIDPLLEKISACGLSGLTRKERDSLSKARETILRKAQAT